uniref:Large ribosomal subunit protein bL34m n=1 Tax=Strigamia maritima TaxID=126957 RepID=T1J9L9_STRMM
MSALSPLTKSIFSLLNPACGLRVSALGLRNVSSMSAPVSGLFRAVFLPIHQSVRTTVRNHFPKASEHIRITRHGWKKRMSTIDGQKVIMRRILRGRFVLSH